MFTTISLGETDIAKINKAKFYYSLKTNQMYLIIKKDMPCRICGGFTRIETEDNRFCTFTVAHLKCAMNKR